jgi:hypothetical protein
MSTFDRVRHYARPYRSALLPAWTRLQTNALWQKGHELRRYLLPARRTHAFSVGLPKTGTTSIARMVEGRTAHEPETNILLYLHDQRAQGAITVAEQARALRARDTLLWLEVESNHLLGLVVEGLVAAFPDARFVLTVRDPRSWLESQINQQYEKGHIEPFATAWRRMYGGVPATKHDERLLREGLYGVGGYLAYWGWQNLHVLRTVPARNRMVVWTHQITDRADQIVRFVGGTGVNYEGTHSNRRREKRLRLDALVDPGYLDDQIARHTAAAAAALREASEAPTPAPEPSGTRARRATLRVGARGAARERPQSTSRRNRPV